MSSVPEVFFLSFLSPRGARIADKHVKSLASYVIPLILWPSNTS